MRRSDERQRSLGKRSASSRRRLHRAGGCIAIVIALPLLLGAAATNTHGELEMIELPNRVRLIVKPNPSNRILAIHCFFQTGSYFERDEQSGITNFVCNTMLQGTENRSAREIAVEMESIGGEIEASASEDYSEVATITTVDDIDKALDILGDVILNPTFPVDEIEKERASILASIRQQQDSSFQLTYKNFRETLYHGHPYAKSVLGTPDTVNAIGQDQLIEFHRANFTATNLLVVVVGDVEAKTVAEKVAATFAGLPPGQAVRMSVSKEFGKRFRTEEIEKQVEQAFVIVGYVTVPARSEDYVPLKVATAVLGTGGTMSSRLFVRLRDQQGLAYAVGSAMPTLRDKSHFFAYIGTKPESAERARKGLLEVIRSLQTEPLPDEELDRAKTSLIGHYRIAHQRNTSQAHYLGLFEMVGLGAPFDEAYAEQVREVTAEQVKEVAKKYFRVPTTAILIPPKAK